MLGQGGSIKILFFPLIIDQMINVKKFLYEVGEIFFFLLCCCCYGIYWKNLTYMANKSIISYLILLYEIVYKLK